MSYNSLLKIPIQLFTGMHQKAQNIPEVYIASNESAIPNKSSDKKQLKSFSDRHENVWYIAERAMHI